MLTEIISLNSAAMSNPLLLTSPAIVAMVGSIMASAGFVMKASAETAFKDQLNQGNINGNVIAGGLKKLVFSLVGIGAVACFAGCVWSGIMLGISSVTQNSQNRMAAIAGVFCAMVGGFIIINAEAIVYYATTLGAA